MIQILFVLLLLFGSSAVGLENFVAPVSKTSDFVYIVDSNLRKGTYLELSAELPLRMHERDDGLKVCCILEQSEQAEVIANPTQWGSSSGGASPYTGEADDSDSDDSNSTGSESTAAAATEEIWLPLQTVFCKELYYNGKQEVYESLNMEGLERWNGSAGVKHRLHFKSEYDEVVGIPITLRQSHVSGATQEKFAIALLLLACLTLCIDKACRSNILFVFCLVTFIILGFSGKFPSSETVLSWIDAGTIFIKMSSNFFVSTLNGTGVHEWIAYKLLNTSHWSPRYLCFAVWIFTGLVAIILPGMATVYLVTKVALIACKELEINPIPAILGQMIMINIGSIGSTVDPAMLIIIKYFDLPPYQTLYVPLVYSLICVAVVAAALMLFYSRELSPKSLRKMYGSPSSSPSPYLCPEPDQDIPSDSTFSTPRISQGFSHVPIPAIELSSLASTTTTGNANANANTYMYTYTNAGTEIRKRCKHESMIGRMNESPIMETDTPNTETFCNASESNSSLPSSQQGSPAFLPTYPVPTNPVGGGLNELRNNNSGSSSEANSPRFVGFGSPVLSSSSMDTEGFSKPREYKIKGMDRAICVLVIICALNVYSLLFTIVGLDFCLFMVLLTIVYAIYLDYKKVEIIYEYFPLENLLLIALSFVFIGSLDELGLSRLSCKQTNKQTNVTFIYLFIF